MPTKIDLSSVYRDAASLAPFPFQRVVAETADADILVAPTGLGKTAAVTLGWAWRRLTMPDATPRRLVWCLPMRTLVEQTHRNAQAWMNQLAALFGKSEQEKPPKVHMAMGGAVDDDWRLAPNESAIVVGPFVVPGHTSCLRCQDLHRCTTEPAYGALLGARLRADRHDGVVEPVDAALAWVALGWAVADLVRYAEGDRPTTWSAAVSCSTSCPGR